MDKSYAQTKPVAYLMYKDGINVNYTNPNHVEFGGDSLNVIKDSILSISLRGSQAMRKVIICFGEKFDELAIRSITFKSDKEDYAVDLNELSLGDGLNVIEKQNGSFSVSNKTGKGYLQTKDLFFYPPDIAFAVFGLLVSLLLLGVLLNKFKGLGELQRVQIPGFADISIILFLISIFLPYRICNYTLLLSAFFILKDFTIKHFIANKYNIIFWAYFFMLFLNDLFVDSSGYMNLRASETYLPFLFLPIFTTCVREQKYLIWLPISAILLGVFMLMTSFVDAFISHNIFSLSFNHFTKFTHPVYFSYLLFFSIFYVFFDDRFNKKIKRSMLIALFFFLILAGSKLVIVLTFAIYSILVLKNKKAIIFILLGTVGLFMFPPIHNRFKEIVNLDDLSVVNKEFISEEEDAKVNGLTLRLLLWQESIKTVETLPELIFGVGVRKESGSRLKENLINRGLKRYVKYSSHNQFVNSFMNTGLVGLLMLCLIVGYGFYKAFKSKNKLLLIMMILFSMAMFTESILERALGIYFFTTILLFLLKPNSLIEDSSTWN